MSYPPPSQPSGPWHDPPYSAPPGDYQPYAPPGYQPPQPPPNPPNKQKGRDQALWALIIVAALVVVCCGLGAVINSISDEDEEDGAGAVGETQPTVEAPDGAAEDHDDDAEQKQNPGIGDAVRDGNFEFT